MTRTRYGACPLCVRFRACPLCVRFRGMSALRPVQGMSALRPVQGMSAFRPVRSMSGLRYGRIVSGLQVVGGLLVFFSCFGPTGCPAGSIGVCWHWALPSPSAKWRSITAAVVRAGGGAMRGCCCCRFRWSGSSLCRRSFSGVYPTRRSWPAPRWDWASRRSSHASSACCAGGVCAPRLKCAFGS